MEEKIFVEKEVTPNDQLLIEALGDYYLLWCNIRDSLHNEYPDLTEGWKYYGKKSGWSLKLLKKKRNLFFFLPYVTGFKIGFVFGDKAVSEVEQSNLPREIITKLLETKKYVEGRGLYVDVKTPQDVAVILELVKIKIAN